MVKAAGFKIFLISSIIFLSGCYTKSDILKRQLIADPKRNTVVVTADGEAFEFSGLSKRSLVRGDFLVGTLTDGRYKQIPVSEVAEMNGAKFDTSMPLYLYAAGGIIVLAFLWVYITSIP